MTQMALPPFQAHSETSRQAAIAIEPNSEALLWQVSRYIRSCGDDGCTDEEGYTALDMNPSTYRPRRIDLYDMGRVKDSGRRRRTKAGRQAVVWVSTEKAKRPAA